jgi:GAF domain-containing protein
MSSDPPPTVDDGIAAGRATRGRTSIERQLDDLRTIADSALSHLELDDLLRELLLRVRDRLDADMATILLLNEEGTELRIRSSLGRDGHVVDRLRIPVGKGLAGRIATAGRALRFDDLRHQEVVGDDLRERMRSLIGMPLVAAGRTIGVIHVASIEPRHFSDGAVALLELAAERASVALENWRLFQAEQGSRMRWEHAARRLARLGRVIGALAQSLDEAGVARVVTDEAMPFLEATGAWLYRVDPSEPVLRTVAVAGYPRRVQDALGIVPIERERPSTRAARTGEPQFVASREELTARFPDLTPYVSRIRPGASAALPLAVGGPPFGVLVLQWDTPRGFDDEESSFLTSLGDQVAQALDRARLYAAERQARELAERAAFATHALQTITSALSAATTVAEVGRATIEHGLRTAGAVAGGVFTVSSDGRCVDVVDSFGYEESVVDRFRRVSIDASLPAAEVCRTGDPVLLADAEAMRERFPDHVPVRHGDSAVATVPLAVGGRVIGCLGLTFAHPKHFDGGEVAFMSAVAAQCSLALERARLYDADDRERRRQAFLAAVGEILSRSLNRERTVSKVARVTVHGVGVEGEEIKGLADWCAVDLVQDDGSIHLAVVEHHDPSKVELAHTLRERHPVGPDDPIGVGHVLRTGRSELVADIDPRLIAEIAPNAGFGRIALELGLRSMMTVPLTARGRTFGAITFACEEDGRRYEPDDVRFAEEVARRASIALDNARLFGERAEIARTLQRALRPADPPVVDGVEIATRYLAAGAGVEVGGDFYEIWISPNGSLWIAIGDVSGKGPTAVDLNLLARHTIRNAAMDEDRPASILRTLNHAMLRQELGERFCTATICRLDRGDSGDHRIEATIASGGHPLPLALSREGGVRRVGTSGMLLGMFPRVRIPERRVRLAIGERLVLYTDGVVEQRSGSMQFGLEGLIAVLRAHASAPAEGLAAAVERATRDVRPDRELLDDVALIVVGPTG